MATCRAQSGDGRSWAPDLGDGRRNQHEGGAWGGPQDATGTLAKVLTLNSARAKVLRRTCQRWVDSPVRLEVATRATQCGRMFNGGPAAANGGQQRVHRAFQTVVGRKAFQWLVPGAGLFQTPVARRKEQLSLVPSRSWKEGEGSASVAHSAASFCSCCHPVPLTAVSRENAKCPPAWELPHSLPHAPAPHLHPHIAC